MLASFAMRGPEIVARAEAVPASDRVEFANHHAADGAKTVRVVQSCAAARLVANFAPMGRGRKVSFRNKNQEADAKLVPEAVS
jgi:hypothetical protein